MSYPSRVVVLLQRLLSFGVAALKVAPFARKNCTRPVPPGFEYDVVSMPIFGSTHSMGSALPVTSAMSGMLSKLLNSCWWRGRRVLQVPPARQVASFVMLFGAH